MKRYLSLLLLVCFLLTVAACGQTPAESTENVVDFSEPSSASEETAPLEASTAEAPPEVDPLETLQALADEAEWYNTHTDISVDQAAIALMEARCEAIKAYALADWYPLVADTTLKVSFVSNEDEDAGVEPDYVEITDREVIAAVVALLAPENIHARVATPEVTDMIDEALGSSRWPKEYWDAIEAHDGYLGEMGTLTLLLGDGAATVKVLAQDSSAEVAPYVTAGFSGGNAVERAREVPFRWSFGYLVPRELQNVIAPYLPGLSARLADH